MCFLGLCIPCLASFNSAELLYSSVILLNFVWSGCEFWSGTFLQIKDIGCPEFSLIVRRNNAKDFDRPVFFEVNDLARRWYLNLVNLPVVGPIRIYQAILFQPGQPMPMKIPKQFEISNTPIPAVKHYEFGFKPSRSSNCQHLFEIIVLCFFILIYVINAKINRNRCVSVGPDQADQVDPVHYFLLFPTPMSINQR